MTGETCQSLGLRLQGWVGCHLRASIINNEEPARSVVQGEGVEQAAREMLIAIRYAHCCTLNTSRHCSGRNH